MHINTLELADNHIQAEGAKYVVEMLRANFTIQHLVCTNLPLEGTSAFQLTFYLTFTVYAELTACWTCIRFAFRIYPTTICSLQELNMWLKYYWTTFH